MSAISLHGVSTDDTTGLAAAGATLADAPPITPRTPAPRFKSTAAFAARSRVQAPTVERATFVTFSVGSRRFAAAVEAVERVLRRRAGETVSGSHVAYAGREVPLADLGAVLGGGLTSTAHTRVLIVNVPGGWIGVTVDDVHEIATVDASGIMPISHDEPAAAIPGVRGCFVRQDVATLVLDVARALGFRRG